MFDIAYDKIPYTGGRYYTFVDKLEFDIRLSLNEGKYRLRDLVRGKTYTFFRVARTEPTHDRPEDVVYMKISGELIDIDNKEMYFMHSPMKGKTMLLDGLGEHWFFVEGKV